MAPIKRSGDNATSNGSVEDKPAALDRARRNSLRLVLERAEMEEKAFLRHEARWSALEEGGDTVGGAASKSKTGVV